MTRGGAMEGGAGGSILADVPHLEASDPLNVEATARDLEQLILGSRSSAPFTVSIEGGWGTGKSTLMRRLRRRLEAQAPGQEGQTNAGVHTVWFNAWSADGTDVLNALIRSALEQIDPSVLRKLARKRHLVRGLGLVAAIVMGVLRIGNLVDRIWQSVESDPRLRNELNDFVRESMELWAQRDRRHDGHLIVVFVDDLDRCSSTTIIQVFEAMKVYLDAPGFVFVLGWDTERVTSTIVPAVGGDDLTADQYVEKIVQIGFRIPRPSDVEIEALTEECCRIAGLEADLGPEHRTLLVETTGGNPRQIKRFINRYLLLRQRIGEADAKTLILLLVLQSSHDALYRLMTSGRGAADDDSDVLAEFARYVEVRRAHDRGDDDVLRELLVEEKLSTNDVEAGFAAYERLRPRSFPQLAFDDRLLALLALIDEETRRSLCSLARSESIETAPSSAPETADAGPLVLWIDDDPKAGDHALLPDDVTLLVATSNDQALVYVHDVTRRPDLVISSMEWPVGPEGGLAGIEAVRAAGYTGPVVYYASRVSRVGLDRAARQDAKVVSRPVELAAAIDLYLPRSGPGPGRKRVDLA
ncbi:MAG TPA: P-loop NTPase fold protein [Iamia sp.]